MNNFKMELNGYENKSGYSSLISETVLGIPGGQEGAESPFRKNDVFINNRITKPWLMLDSLFRFTTLAKREMEGRANKKNYARELLRKRKQEMKSDQNSSDAKSLLDMLIKISEDNKDFTEEDIVIESCTLMLAGQDSVSAPVLFALYFLAKYPEIQSKVRDELQSIFTDDTRLPDLNDLGEMKYLEQCIKEAMRLCPSVAIIARTLIDDVVVGEHVLPSGALVLVSPFLTQRLPHLYADPLKYDPERFSSENIQKIHPYAYLPFSAGPRNCLGSKYAMLEMKTIISTIIRNYRFTLSPGHEELVLGYRVSIGPKGGIWLRFNRII